MFVRIISQKGEELIKQDSLRQVVTVVIPNDCEPNIVEYELIKAIYPLIQKIALNF